MVMSEQEKIQTLIDDFDEIGQIMKDWDKIRQMVGVDDGATGVDPDSAQTKFVELLLVASGGQQSFGHEQLKEAARQWLEANVSGLAGCSPLCKVCGNRVLGFKCPKCGR